MCSLDAPISLSVESKKLDAAKLDFYEDHDEVYVSYTMDTKERRTSRLLTISAPGTQSDTWKETDGAAGADDFAKRHKKDNLQFRVQGWPKKIIVLLEQFSSVAFFSFLLQYECVY